MSLPFASGSAGASNGPLLAAAGCSQEKHTSTACARRSFIACTMQRSLLQRGATAPSSANVPCCRRRAPASTGRSTRPAAASAAPGIATAPVDVQGFEEFVNTMQEAILSEAEQLDGSGRRFVRDRWEREGGNAGYGITAVLEDGDLLEKAAANVSIVRGTLSAARAQAMSSRGRGSIDAAGGQPYSAAALSLVFHAAHPLVPTLRADVRLFQVDGQAWFGGGCDLTPSYLFEEDAVQFHQHWKDVCERYDAGVYPPFKEWCDRYFHIPARKEHRGIGGIFFDDLSAQDVTYDVQAFVHDVAHNILPSWRSVAERRRAQPFTEEQRQWQLLRRGRYLEFNLLYDRGVKFGLDGGRVESIMVSAPPLIAWRYKVEPEAGSPEAQLVEVLQRPRDWLAQQ